MIMAGHSQVEDDQQSNVEFCRLLNNLSAKNRHHAERLRRRLVLFFMGPLEKWRVGRRVPFKLLLQAFKIVFITLQVVFFAQLRMAHVEFMEDTNTVLRHQFLRDWQDVRDVIVYPPAAGHLSAFTSNQLWSYVAFAIKAYYKIGDAFAAFSYNVTKSDETSEKMDDMTDSNYSPFSTDIPPISVRLKRITSVHVVNDTYAFDTRSFEECKLLNFTDEEISQIKTDKPMDSQIRKMVEKRGVTFNALLLTEARLEFNLRTIHFSTFFDDGQPECYQINVGIFFDNSRHTGQVLIGLESEISYVNKCNGRLLYESMGPDTTKILIGILDLLVLLVCIASLCLCCRALIRAHLLKNNTNDYFSEVLNYPLSLSDRLDFLNLWFVMIVINDILIIFGTLLKVTIEFRDFDNNVFTWTGILLGSGTLLVYMGVLRYLGFFPQYNILILTLKKALPSILEFMSCAALIYVGFLLTGWVIIGPYSLKFRTLSQSSEALFSLLNGDDMFATFFTIKDSNRATKLFGTIYIYIFVSLFTYAVLSLTIAIIMDAYEVVKERYNHGSSNKVSVLREFMNRPTNNMSGDDLQPNHSNMSNSTNNSHSNFGHFESDTVLDLADCKDLCLWCCSLRSHRAGVSGYEQIDAQHTDNFHEDDEHTDVEVGEDHVVVVG